MTAGVDPLDVVVPPPHESAKRLPIESSRRDVAGRQSRGVEAVGRRKLNLKRVDGSELRERSERGCEAKIPKLSGVLFFQRRSGFTELKIVRLECEFQRTFGNRFTEVLDEDLAVFDQEQHQA